jgi:Flp pilus assembly protein CpaB
MSRRARAVAFGCAALACAGVAAAMASGYRSDIRSELGPLRSVVVATARIPAHQEIPAKGADKILETRRVPARFAPPGALSHPEEAVGRAPASAIALGSYVLASQLKDAGSGREPRSGRARIGAGRKPVQITVTGAEALGASGADPVGARVDVVVTTEPGPGGGSGRTYVAAREVRLLALSQGADSSVNDYSPSDDDQWTATLALTKPQALRLIQAESFARGVRLIAH